MSLQVCWFRTDLRIHDNNALIQALNKGQVVAIYIATPEQWQAHDDAPIKIDFWRRNLETLQSQLEKLNIPLICFQVPHYQDIPGLMEQFFGRCGISALHINNEYPLNERQRDSEVEQACDRLGVKFFAYEDQCLLPPDFVLTKADRPFKVFTPYANKSREILEASGGVSSYGLTLQSPQQETPDLPALAQQKMLNEIDWPESNKAWQELWPAGEQYAQQRLDNFVAEKLKGYKYDRDFPALDGTSTLSPYLCSGVISVRQCWEKAVSPGMNSSVRSWCNELLWRDFYKYVVYHFPHVCKHQAWNAKYANIPWRHAESEFICWTQGETGFPLIDAAMKQLLETGWMHNRLRMVVAMFLSKNLLIDWRWGERWFMQHLVDGDFAANNGGWQWSASTGTDAVPYFRIFNPVRQSERFDPDGHFIKQYIPALLKENLKSIHDPAKLLTDYTKPIVDLSFSRERALATFRLSG